MSAGHQIGRGQLQALAAAVGFGLVPPLARLGYDAGASPLAVASAQIALAAIVLAVAVVARKASWRLPRGAMGATVAVAICWLVVTLAYLAAIVFIPVSLAVLLFYTFPVMTIIAEALFHRRPVQRTALSAGILALGGLALALGVELYALDPRGIALAAVAALATTATFLVSQRLMAAHDVLVVNVYIHLIGAALLAAGIVAFGAPPLPASASGWAAVLATVVLYLAAVLLQFGAIRHAGSARASVVFNVEPIVTLLAAAVILGELLGLREATGAALVVTAVLLSSRSRERISQPRP